MAVDPQILAAIANPSGGRLGQIGETFAKRRQEVKENERAETRLSEQQKTAKLTRQLLQQDIDAGQVEALLSNSKILTGVTDQFEAAAETNPMLKTNPKMYEQFMMDITQGLPDEVTAQFKGVMPDQFKQINRRANRMVKVLSDLEEVETFGNFGRIKGTDFYGEKSNKTGKHANVKLDPNAGNGAGGTKPGDYKPATLNDIKVDAATETLSKAGLPDDEGTIQAYQNQYERHFRDTGDTLKSERLAIADLKKGIVRDDGLLYNSEEYNPSAIELTEDEIAELEEYEALEAAGEL